MNKLRTLWTNNIEEMETFLNYKFSEDIKEKLKGKYLKNCSEHINEYLDEHIINICYSPYENMCFKYNESERIIVKGESKIYPVWEYSGINYSLMGVNYDKN